MHINVGNDLLICSKFAINIKLCLCFLQHIIAPCNFQTLSRDSFSNSTVLHLVTTPVSSSNWKEDEVSLGADTIQYPYSRHCGAYIPFKEHFPQRRCILQWASQLDHFLLLSHVLVNVCTRSTICYHCLSSCFPLSAISPPLSLPSASSISILQDYLWICSSASSPLLLWPLSTLSPQLWCSLEETHLKWCFITTSSWQTFPQLRFPDNI